jgi:hypothetical protein
MLASEAYINREVYVPRLNSWGRVIGAAAVSGSSDYMKLVELKSPVKGESRYWLHAHELRASTIDLPPNCS